MKTVRDACQLQPNALSIKLSDQIEQLDELISTEGDGSAFFEKTHITQGMKDLISEGIARLAGASSQAVFHLKQAMGGGKTHLLVGFGLLAKHPSLRAKHCAGVSHAEAFKIAAIAAFNGRNNPDHFFWGEIANQLGKGDQFRGFWTGGPKAPDEKDWLNLFEGDQPVLILLDEMPPYFHYLDTQKVGNGTVADIATRAFANLLTASGKKKNVCIVVSDLAAAYDTGGRLINKALQDARAELGRQERNITPVDLAANEIYDILRKRLFKALPDKSEIEDIADSFAVNQEQAMDNVDPDSGLILAAEECPPEKFEAIHSFSQHDEVTIRKLSAHGPVLLRGGRGSGKSALLIEAYRRMRVLPSVFPVFVSLRYLPLLQSDGQEYIGHFCVLLSQAIAREINQRQISYDFGVASDQASLQLALTNMAQARSMRVVLLFDDAAHIGREKPLEVFFDLFRTLSSNLTSCKASIYPGVTKFGIRFDVYNDATVIDISRSDVSAVPDFFPEVVKARYPMLADRETFSDRLAPAQFANLLGRAVVGNLRGFILACNRFDGREKIGIPEVSQCILDMASDYFWPLMEEVAPKLGVYEALVDPAREVVEVIVDHVSRSVRERTKVIAQDRVLIHRQIVGQFVKLFEILEYLGFVSRREASRGMKSGGRGPVYAINLCNLLDAVPSKRLTIEMIEEWTLGKSEPAEMHVSGQAFQAIKLPSLPEEHGLAILDKPITVLARSRAYPYGLTGNIIERLVGAGLQTVGRLANSTDAELDRIDYIGEVKIKIIRDVVFQAIWM